MKRDRAIDFLHAILHPVANVQEDSYEYRKLIARDTAILSMESWDTLRDEIASLGTDNVVAVYDVLKIIDELVENIEGLGNDDKRSS